jgi:hypothetical protein
LAACQDDNVYSIKRLTLKIFNNAAQPALVHSRKDRATHFEKLENVILLLHTWGRLSIDTLSQKLMGVRPANTYFPFEIFSGRFLNPKITQGGNRNHQTENCA